MKAGSHPSRSSLILAFGQVSSARALDLLLIVMISSSRSPVPEWR